MIFQKPSPKIALTPMPADETEDRPAANDDIETVVGPSVNVEGDFASEGNIIVKGSVSGSVRTSRFLSVEPGAKINANVAAESARIAGEIRGNLKIKESLELTSTARVLGDIVAKTLQIEAGALLYGKVVMPGLEGADNRMRQKTIVKKTFEETPVVAA